MEDIVVTVLDTDYIPEYEEKEEERRNNEEARVISENERIQSENTRIANEEVRQTNETNRIAQYNLIQSKLNNGDFNGEDGYSPTVTTSKVDRTTTITITDKNGDHTATILDGEDGSASGDMLKSVYDTNNNGIVDNAEKVNNHTVQTDVPANAVFTDTVFSGNYNDLSNKPNIPSKTSDLTNDSGFISSYTETDPTVPSYVKGITQQNITDWGNKQDELVSGTNIKTVNNESILGSGNIAISSGATYTAGTNIEIASGNVINNTIPFEKNDSLKSFILGEKSQSFTHKSNNLAIGNGSILDNTQTVLIGNGSTSSKMRNVGITSSGALLGEYNVGIGYNINILKDNSIAIGGLAYVNAKDSIALGYHASISENNACQIGSNDSKINKIYIYTSNGNKQLATQDYVDTAIATAITSALGGSY